MTGPRPSTDPKAVPDGSWGLADDGGARFGELVRRVQSEGPQHVTVRGQEVVVISAEDFRRLKGEATGQALVAAFQASPDREIEIEPERYPMPVGDPVL